ncbi:RNAse P Rpr2/Rpp21/SNM1 subunit domain-containing protein [Microdochium nivale]|nr:RNAse P Rpr2/Rpp21/SNM1 subunit domain-containing protein [Microdochium nivale]
MTALTESLPASLVFLTDAAHLLAAACPQTSAHLMSQRSALMSSNNLVVSDTQRQHACTACGHIMVPGHGDLLSLDSHKTALRRRTRTRKLSVSKKGHSSSFSSTSSRERTKHLVCAMCTSYTDIKVPLAPKINRRRPAVTAVSSKTSTSATPVSVSAASTTQRTAVVTAPAPSSAATSEPAKPASINASSKKRAKSRKQGLQALLQQSRSSAPQTGSGLSLADFMKK